MGIKLLSPSILSADLSILGEEVGAVESAGADSIHVDVMDGLFVPNITFGPTIVQAISKSTSLPVDVHLMVSSPERYITTFVSAGAASMSVHQEACGHLHRTIQLIKHEGIKAGIALNPSTPLCQIKWLLQDVDFILIMGVNPGFAGQKFIDTTLSKVSKLRGIIEDKGLKTHIQVDGGVNAKTIGGISLVGANIFVVGSAIFNNSDYSKAMAALRSEL